MSSDAFDFSKDRKLQFMIKLNGAVLVDPRTPSMSGIGAVIATPQATPQSKALQPHHHHHHKRTSSGLPTISGHSRGISNASNAATNNNRNDSGSSKKDGTHPSSTSHHNNKDASLLLSHYCFYMKWSRGSHSGKFAPFPLRSAHTRDDGRIEFVFPPSDTSYENSFPVDFGSGAGLETKRFTVSCYMLQFTKNAMDPLMSPEKRMEFFRSEDNAGRVLRSTIVESFCKDLNKWLAPAKPCMRRQQRLDFTTYDTLVLDYAVLRHDDVLPPSIQSLSFDGSAGASAGASASVLSSSSDNRRRASPAAAAQQLNGATAMSPDALANNNNNNSLSNSSVVGMVSPGSDVQVQSPGAAAGAAAAAADDTIISEPDLRPGIPVQGRPDIFRALSAALSKSALDAKLSISLTNLTAIFETGNRAVLKLPGMSTAAAFSLLLSNDSPFLTTFHEKRQDKGFMNSPWKPVVASAATADQQQQQQHQHVRMRASGYEMRFGGHYIEAKEHSFVMSYRLPSDYPPGTVNYVGQFHIQPTGIASAARVELAIHIGNGLMDSITSGGGGAVADGGEGDGSGGGGAGAAASSSTTVHFAMAVTFTSPTIEGRFRSKADAMIPKMLNALSTTAKALLGADDLARAASDAAATAAGRAYLRKADSRVSIDPLLALRPYAMKSNAAIAQHFLKMATHSPTAMRPKPTNLELIASLVTIHLKHESIVKLAMAILDRSIARHGRGIATYCPGLSDAVERARSLYNLPPVQGGATSLDFTVEQLLDRQVYEDIRAVGVWRVLEGKSKVSMLAASESSFFMGDIHRVRVTLPALRELFEARAGVRSMLQLGPEQVNVLIALLSLHLNHADVVDTVTFALERTSTTCLVQSSTLHFLVDSVYNLYPQWRSRLDALRASFVRFQQAQPDSKKDLASKFGSALTDGDPVFQCKCTLYQPVDEGEVDLVLTRKSFYLGSIAFPLEHLYTISRTKVYLFFPAIRIVTQKPRVVVTTGNKDPEFEPLRDELSLGEDDELSLLDGSKTLDNAFRDLDISVAANFEGLLGDELDGDGGGGGLDDGFARNGEFIMDEELPNYYSTTGGGGGHAPFTTMPGAYMGNESNLSIVSAASAASATRGAGGNTNKNKKNGMTQNKEKDVAVTFLAKCWNIEGLYNALEEIGYGGRITGDL